MHIFILSIYFAIFFLSGCAQTVGVESSLKPEEKKEIFQNVQKEIDTLIQKGDILYAKRHFQGAIEAYKKANFYNGSPIIPLEKINIVQKRANANREFYYNRGIEQLKKDKIAALHEFNRMMRNDREYKDGRAIYEKLKEDVEVKAFLEKLKKPLRSSLESYQKKSSDLKKLNNMRLRLAKYDDNDPLVLQAEEMIDTRHNKLVEEAIAIYKSGDIAKAKEHFEAIKEIYLRDGEAEKYLREIAQKERIDEMFGDAKKALESGEYEQSKAIIEKILEIDPENQDAKNRIKKIEEESEKRIPTLIEEAKVWYGQQEFQKALELFKKVLVYEPDNNTSLTYVKKIENLLKTLEKLK